MFYRKHVISSVIGCAATAFFLAACGNDYSIEPSAEDSAIQKMSLREKVGQMFFDRTPDINDVILNTVGLLFSILISYAIRRKQVK